jgi:pimeloyl-ACP methyl ester carboxylesterase
MACNAYEGALASAARIQCPALVVSGSRDIMTPARAAKPLVEALRGRPEPGSGTTVVELADCGHAMMAEQPDRVLRVLRQFWTNHHA